MRKDFMPRKVLPPVGGMFLSRDRSADRAATSACTCFVRMAICTDVCDQSHQPTSSLLRRRTDCSSIEWPPHRRSSSGVMVT